MRKWIGSTVAGWLMSVVCLVPATGHAERQLVQMPAMMQEHMLGNMRNHLVTLNEIISLVAAGSYDRAGALAEAQLGMSSLPLHGAAHMAPYMPQPMQAIGTNMHKAASRFARAAQNASVERDLPQLLHRLSDVTAQCAACHAAYRIR
jgi:hypothetical protein